MSYNLFLRMTCQNRLLDGNFGQDFGVCVREEGRTSAILVQASKARLGENSRDSKPGFVRASRSGESISPKREIERL